MLFRDGGDGRDHMHVEKGEPGPMKVQGKFTVETTVVRDLDEEMVALEEGWRLTADPDGVDAREDARDAEIRKLREQIAGMDPQAEPSIRRGPGRPRKEVTYGDAA
jgi:hypothetical protein